MKVFFWWPENSKHVDVVYVRNQIMLLCVKLLLFAFTGWRKKDKDPVVTVVKVEDFLLSLRPSVTSTVSKEKIAVKQRSQFGTSVY